MINTYERGYFKALLDVSNWVNSHSEGMERFHMFTEKRMKNFLADLTKHKEELMRYAEYAEFIVNDDGHIINE